MRVTGYRRAGPNDYVGSLPCGWNLRDQAHIFVVKNFGQGWWLEISSPDVTSCSRKRKLCLVRLLVILIACPICALAEVPYLTTHDWRVAAFGGYWGLREREVLWLPPGLPPRFDTEFCFGALRFSLPCRNYVALLVVGAVLGIIVFLGIRISRMWSETDERRARALHSVSR